MQFHLLSIGCHVYSYSTVNRRTFDLLHKLQLLPAMDCSGTPHVVDHCSLRWSAVVPLYFHCTLTANISSALFHSLFWHLVEPATTTHRIQLPSVLDTNISFRLDSRNRDVDIRSE